MRHIVKAILCVRKSIHTGRQPTHCDKDMTSIDSNTLHTYQYQMSFTHVTRCLVLQILQIESNSDAFKMQSETWLWAKVSSWTLHSLEWRAPVVPGRSPPGWWKVLSIFKVWQGNEIIRFSDRKRVRTWEILSTIYGKVWKGTAMPID